jgi:hypothetical protein
MIRELQARTESLRRMVDTRDLIIADQAREIRELKAMLNGTCDPCDTCGSTLHHSDLCERQFSIAP